MGSGNRPFILVGRQQDTATPHREPEPSASQDLIQLHGLGRIAAKVMASELAIEGYVEPSFKGLYEGNGMDLASLADIHPSSDQMKFEPFSTQDLESCFKLEPGKFSLPESDKGVPVDVKALGKVDAKEETAKMTDGAAKPLKLKLKI